MKAIDYRSLAQTDLQTVPFPPVEQELRVIIQESAFDRICARGKEGGDVEVGGVLVGQVRQDDGGPYVLVEDTIDALHAMEGKTELTFTHETWAHINAEMDNRQEGRRIVGWYHTHPGFGVFLSDRDLFIHQGFFNLPFQIALVHDPKARQHGVFIWKDGCAWRARRFWIGGRESAWDGPRPAPTTNRKAEPKDKEEGPLEKKPAPKPSGQTGEDEEQPLLPFSQPVYLGIMAIVLVLIGLLLGFWLSGGGRAGDTLAEREKYLQARTEGFEAALGVVHSELLSLLRADVGYAAQQRGFQDIQDRLGKVADGLAGPPPAGASRDKQALEAAQQIREALASFTTMRNDFNRVDRLLVDLENAAKRSGKSVPAPSAPPAPGAPTDNKQ